MQRFRRFDAAEIARERADRKASSEEKAGSNQAIFRVRCPKNRRVFEKPRFSKTRIFAGSMPAKMPAHRAKSGYAQGSKIHAKSVVAAASRAAAKITFSEFS